MTVRNNGAKKDVIKPLQTLPQTNHSKLFSASELFSPAGLQHGASGSHLLNWDTEGCSG